jgi:predicted SnoaL-like aldol condensation-catalyzing enzyme
VGRRRQHAAAGYIQHSEGINADGIAGSKPIIEQLIGSGNLVYDKIDKVIGEGNFALVISEGSFQHTPYSFYDFFRMAHGQIQEHWDVLQPLTPPDQAKNNNGQFNFPPRSAGGAHVLTGTGVSQHLGPEPALPVPAPSRCALRRSMRRATSPAVGDSGFSDGSAYGSAFRSRLLPAAFARSPGHRLDLG